MAGISEGSHDARQIEQRFVAVEGALLYRCPVMRWCTGPSAAHPVTEASAYRRFGAARTARRRCRSVRQSRSRRLAEANGKFVEAAEHESVAVCPAQVAAFDSEFEVREASEQCAERDACLEACQWRAEAEVDAVSESEVWTWLSVDVEDGGVVVDAGIMVGCAEADEYLLVGGDLDAF